MMNSDAPAIHGTRLRALAGATLGFFVGFAAVSLFGPTARLLKQAMDLTPFQVGLLVAVPSATGSILRIPFGAWVDTSGGRKPFIILLLLSAAGLAGLLVLLATRYPTGLTGGAYYGLVLGLGMMAGCGIATFSVGIGQVSYWYPEARQGAALAIYAGVGNLAPGIFAFIIPLTIGLLGLYGTYAAWLAFLLLGILLYGWLGCNAPFFQFQPRVHAGNDGSTRIEAIQHARRHGQELFPSGGVAEGLIRAIRIPRTWALIYLYFASFGGFLALTAWLPTYWDERFAVSMAWAGSLTMVYSVLTSAIRVPGGFLSDRVGGEQTAMGAFTIMMIGAAAVAVSRSMPAAVAGCLLMAAGMGVANAAVFKLVPRYLGSVGSGAGAGWVGGLGAFGGFVLPPIMGGLIEVFGRETGFILCFSLFATLAGGCLLVICFLVRAAVPTGAGPPEPFKHQVVCPLTGQPAQVLVQAISGEIPSVRLVRCSLLADGDTCEELCMSQIEIRHLPLESLQKSA